ncbi:hypothetical protein TNCV_426141 [Trichonephila clavipes]|nr:hypothetical protein TNCV_426141 [Trichonephila clavipes]
MNETTQQEKTTQLSSRNEQLNSSVGTKQLNSTGENNSTRQKSEFHNAGTLHLTLLISARFFCSARDRRLDESIHLHYYALGLPASRELRKTGHDCERLTLICVPRVKCSREKYRNKSNGWQLCAADMHENGALWSENLSRFTLLRGWRKRAPGE